MEGKRGSYVTSRQAKRQDIQELDAWLSERNALNDVPRMVDIWEHVQRNTNWQLSLRDVKRAVRLHHNYMMNVPQSRPQGRSKLYRPIVMTNLGHWHADVGFFPINKRYRTPLSFRAGFLVAKDVVSRYIYATPLIKDRTANSMIRAFDELFGQHYGRLPNVAIKSISFDRETSVMSKRVQEYFEKRGIDFHAFKLSSSKAKAAENAIKQIRTKMARLMRQNREKDRWWRLLPAVVDNLNSQKIVLDNKNIGFAPKDVNQENLEQFLESVYNKVPAYLWAQVDIDPEFVDFKYKVGTKVRVKLIETSSALLGIKRSEINLTSRIFVIEKLVPFITRKMTIGKAYLCRDLEMDETEVLEEHWIVEAIEDDDDRYPSLAETVGNVDSDQEE